MSLTPDQVNIIRSTVPVLREHGNAITKTFYHTLLDENPDLNNIFNQANQANSHQAQALAGALYAYAQHIDDLGALSPAVERICQKHASLYIKPEQYDVVGRYLLRAMGDVLGEALTPEVLEAWGAAYWQLANIMIKKEDEILQGAGDWLDWRDFRIASKVKESEEISSFYLKPVDGKPLPPFMPGQYISVMTEVPQLKYKQSRQYSLSDSPKREYYRVSIKKDLGLTTAQSKTPEHPGYISNVMHDSKQEGDIISVSHPAGEFFLDLKSDTEGPVVLLSAGVGLTPMLSMLNTLIDRKSTRRISWIHAARSTSAQAFGDYIRDVCSEHEEITSSVFIGKPDQCKDHEGVQYQHAGRMKLEALDRDRELCLDDGRAEYYICGPEGFMGAMEKSLLALGVDGERIKYELFGSGEMARL